MTGSVLFDGLPKGVYEDIKNDKRCRIECYAPGDVIYTADNFERSLGLIINGSAVVKSHGGSGVIVRRLEADDCFGAAALFSQRENYVSEITALKNCSVLFIPEDVIKAFMERYPRLSLNYIRFLTGRIEYLNTLVDAYSSSTVISKVSKFIYAHQLGSGVPFGFNLTELSKSLGIGRASLYRALDELENSGAIKKDGKNISVLDLDKLIENVS